MEDRELKIWRIELSSIILVLLAVISLILFLKMNNVPTWFVTKSNETSVSQDFWEEGEFCSPSGATYKVEIYKSPSWLDVKLESVGDSNYSIIGHYHDQDGQWDHVIYCGDHELIGVDPRGYGFNCNSVFRTESGWEFEACLADKGSIQPFSDEAISFAIAELNFALEKILGEGLDIR